MKFSDTEAALTYFHKDREKHLLFIEKMNSKDSEFIKIEDVDLRQDAIMEEIGLKKLPQGEEEEAFNELTIAFLNFNHHNRYTLLRTREQVYLETIRNLMQPLDLGGTIPAEDRLKNVKLKGDLNDLAGRLVSEIESLYKEIYGNNEEMGKDVMKKNMTLEKRLKKNGSD